MERKIRRHCPGFGSPEGTIEGSPDLLGSKIFKREILLEEIPFGLLQQFVVGSFGVGEDWAVNLQMRRVFLRSYRRRTCL